MMNALNAEMTIRHVDGQLVYFVCGLEEGEENQNSHLQLTYMLQVAERNKTTSAAEKKWLKGVVQDAANASMRVTFKTVKKGNEKYVVGYCIKDEGLAHSVLIVMGLSEEEKAEARDVYIAKASDFDQAQSKMNKTPLKTIKKQVAFMLQVKQRLYTVCVVHRQARARRRCLFSHPSTLNCIRHHNA